MKIVEENGIPLSITVAARLAESFDGELPMSFSGGADQKNIDQIVGCGIWPVTVATVLLKPGGYKWMTRIAEKADECEVGECGKVKVEEVKKLAESALADAHYQKNTKKAAGKRNEEKSPMLRSTRRLFFTTMDRLPIFSSPVMTGTVTVTRE